MKHRTAFIVATALTAFVLMLIGGIAFAVTPKAVAFNPTATATATDTATLTGTATNTKMPSPTATATKVSAPTASFLMPADASRIALKLAPHAKLKQTPELVNYKGHMAYEVLFDIGTVYVDAFTGKILSDLIEPTPTPTLVPPPPDPGNGGGGGGNNKGGGNGNPTQPNPPAGNPAPPQPPPGGGYGGHDGPGDDHEHGGDH